MEKNNLFPPANYKEVLEQLRAVNEERRKDNSAYLEAKAAEERKSHLLFLEMNRLLSSDEARQKQAQDVEPEISVMMQQLVARDNERRAAEEAERKQAKDDIAQLNELRARIDTLEELRTDEALGLMTEAVQLCARIAKRDAESRGEYREMVKLVELFVPYVNHLLQFDHLVDVVQSATYRMVEALGGYPRKKLAVMRLRLEALVAIENREMHELGITEDLRDDIRFYERNIAAADRGDFDSIVQKEYDGRAPLSKCDPIEWTEFWEDVIDAVNEYVYKNLECRSRGMGFCHVYWNELGNVMREKFGVEWRSPVVMNPGTHFD
ncbi:MAG: hypothetical protein IKZ37_05755 [Bacteroidaceae bacterium]|nr:hypothetical protein [Bacteroidaceae bacterium]